MADTRGNTGFDFGIDYSEFDALIKQVEGLVEDTDEIAKSVIEAGIQAAQPKFIANVPVGDGANPQGRAKDNVTVSGLKTSKHGTKYRLISFRGDRSYLYMIDQGTSKLPPHPWLDKARAEAGQAAVNAMSERLKQEIKNRVGE
ncbi:MAG: hypothetical protein J6A61_05770 [Clostridia bacterium]|nr:hypothetical protein [Clostridia bacterium]